MSSSGCQRSFISDATLNRAKRCADDHRAEIYNISGWWHELRLWAKGRARSISAAIDNVHEVRVLIAVSVPVVLGSF